MARTQWVVEVVGRKVFRGRNRHTARTLLKWVPMMGIKAALRFEQVAREMSPKGLRRWAHEHRN